MPQYTIAFFSDQTGICQKKVEAESREKALRLFFDKNTTGYSQNDEGFVYFCEDFEDADRPLGAILEN
jgi:hypothetical protein